jgi:serine/threonine protein kinase
MLSPLPPTMIASVAGTCSTSRAVHSSHINVAHAAMPLLPLPDNCIDTNAYTNTNLNMSLLLSCQPSNLTIISTSSTRGGSVGAFGDDTEFQFMYPASPPSSEAPSSSLLSSSILSTSSSSSICSSASSSNSIYLGGGGSYELPSFALTGDAHPTISSMGSFLLQSPSRKRSLSPSSGSSSDDDIFPSKRQVQFRDLPPSFILSSPASSSDISCLPPTIAIPPKTIPPLTVCLPPSLDASTSPFPSGYGVRCIGGEPCIGQLHERGCCIWFDHQMDLGTCNNKRVRYATLVSLIINRDRDRTIWKATSNDGRSVVVKFGRRPPVGCNEDPVSEITMFQHIQSKGGITGMIELVGAYYSNACVAACFPTIGEGNLWTFINHEIHAREEKASTSDKKIPTRMGCIEADARSIFGQLAATLASLHGLGITHLDIKLENILIERQAEGQLRVILIDLGQATRHETLNHTTVINGYHGTTGYSAPEVTSNSSTTYNPYLADIWSMGCTLYALLVGRSLFDHRHDKEGDDEARSIRDSMYRLLAQHDGLRQHIRFLDHPYRYDHSYAIDLLERTLRPQDQRATIHDVLSHAWLTSSMPIITNYNTPLPHSISSSSPSLTTEASFSPTHPSKCSSSSTSPKARGYGHHHHYIPSSPSHPRLSHNRYFNRNYVHVRRR